MNKKYPNLTPPKVAFKDKIRATEMYGSLIPVLRTIILKRNNVAHIQHGYTVAKNVGLPKWKKQTNYKERNIVIIEQILKNEKA